MFSNVLLRCVCIRIIMESNYDAAPRPCGIHEEQALNPYCWNFLLRLRRFHIQVVSRFHQPWKLPNKPTNVSKSRTHVYVWLFKHVFDTQMEKSHCEKTSCYMDIIYRNRSPHIHATEIFQIFSASCKNKLLWFRLENIFWKNAIIKKGYVLWK